VRFGNGKKFLFILNFTPEPVDVPIPANWKAALDVDLHDGVARLPGYGSSVFMAV
jgi:hypothetical protein